jgi:ATP-dependent helicase HepA
MDNFVPGQRWLSETQGELGLGLVTAVEGRLVEIDYPATGEQRIYALPDPPLVRLELTAGEHVRDREGQGSRYPLRVGRRGFDHLSL